jgi:predicted DNA-binding transcriptional regulator AlpA
VPDRVLTLKQWAELNALSLRTAARLIAGGDGPPILRLSNRRIGIRESDAARWQAARLRGLSA